MSSREYVVGAGDGGVYLVRDLIPKITLAPTDGKRGRRTTDKGGAPTTVNEPTKACLKEVLHRMIFYFKKYFMFLIIFSSALPFSRAA